MPLYTYRCENCGEQFSIVLTFAEHDDYRKVVSQHTSCAAQGFRADFLPVLGVNFIRPMQEHYNHSLDRYVANEREVNDELKRQSDAMSARMPGSGEPATVSTRGQHRFGCLLTAARWRRRWPA